MGHPRGEMWVSSWGSTGRRDAVRKGNAHRHCDSFTDAYRHAHARSHAYVRSHAHTYARSDRDGNSNRHAYSDQHTDR